MSPQRYKARFLEPKSYSFDLHVDMVRQLAEEFNPREAVRRFVAGEDAVKVFGGYGEALAKRCLELGQEYPDRTLEVLEGIFERTNGAYRFPLLVQRYLEIAYLSAQDLSTLPIMSNNPSQLVYRVVKCALNRGLIEECGESSAAKMLCRQACLNLGEGVLKGLDIDANMTMEASMATEGYCQFAMRPGKAGKRRK